MEMISIVIDHSDRRENEQAYKAISYWLLRCSLNAVIVFAFIGGLTENILVVNK
jgi:hypothetical protein